MPRLPSYGARERERLRHLEKLSKSSYSSLQIRNPDESSSSHDFKQKLRAQIDAAKKEMGSSEPLTHLVSDEDLANLEKRLNNSFCNKPCTSRANPNDEACTSRSSHPDEAKKIRIDDEELMEWVTEFREFLKLGDKLKAQLEQKKKEQKDDTSQDTKTEA
ncbi:hypothetical protein L596_009554 [Steinernema carpocapsae]|uniref:Uncharacterized protein n=1 Tax=Steinernema carpocapsae TaxID=34508 RepID=A0A4V6A6R5_STECR|nr:hypothetical protein L596_009554 [Steinernema carpocapsae]